MQYYFKALYHLNHGACVSNATLAMIKFDYFACIYAISPQNIMFWYQTEWAFMLSSY